MKKDFARLFIDMKAVNIWKITLAIKNAKKTSIEVVFLCVLFLPEWKVQLYWHFYSYIDYREKFNYGV